MVQIGELSADASPQSLNQATRWVMTKEEHASKIITTVADYMLAQRVKAAEIESRETYLEVLAVHHDVMQSAMKTKQTVDVAAADALDHALEHLAPIYPK